jgi:hypothetical protein
MDRIQESKLFRLVFHGMHLLSRTTRNIKPTQRENNVLDSQSPLFCIRNKTLTSRSHYTLAIHSSRKKKYFRVPKETALGNYQRPWTLPAGWNISLNKYEICRTLSGQPVVYQHV